VQVDRDGVRAECLDVPRQLDALLVQQRAAGGLSPVGDVGMAIIVLVLIQRLGGRLAVTGFRGG